MNTPRRFALLFGAQFLGFGAMLTAGFWWCVAGCAITGVLNVTVSFVLALKVALRSRSITLADRRRLYAAIRLRLRQAPLSFLLPERE